MLKLQARPSVRALRGRRRPSGIQRTGSRPQRFAPTITPVRVTLVALGLAAPAGALLVQRRRARLQPRSRVERVAVAIQQRPLLAPSLLAGAGALTVGYLFLRRRRVARRVRQAMTPNPRAVEPATLLSEAAQLMKQDDVGSLPVVEKGRLIGMLTDRDIVTRAVAEGIDASACRVGDIASRDLITVEPEQNLDEALRLMARYKVRRLPVVDGDRLVGILGQADVAGEEKDKRVGKVIEQISEPMGASAPRE